MEPEELAKVQEQAASALEAGMRLATRAADRRTGRALTERPNGAALGTLLSNPLVFWSGAATVEAYGDGDAVEPMSLAIKFASAKLAAGDFDFVRETLLGQASWAGVLAVKLAQKAGAETRHDRAMGLLKLSLQAQRQAAAALATAAALNRLVGV